MSESKPTTLSRPIGPAFLLVWILVHAIGLLVGTFVGLVLGTFVPGLRFSLEQWAVPGVTIGVLVGAPQWLMLRRLIPLGGTWVLATAAGFALAILVSLIPFVQLSSTTGTIAIAAKILALVAIGSLVGTAQWFLLRRLVPKAGWWIVMNALGYAFGNRVSTMGIPFGRWFVLLVWGGVYGLIIGGTLMRLMRPENSPSHKVGQLGS